MQNTPTFQGETLRVRDQVRDGLAVIAFSAIASTAMAATFGLVIGLLGS